MILNDRVCSLQIEIGNNSFQYLRKREVTLFRLAKLIKSVLGQFNQLGIVITYKMENGRSQMLKNKKRNLKKPIESTENFGSFDVAQKWE